MDAAGWETMDDLFRSFFQLAGAPSWHGKNFNALRNSIATGAINKVEVPCRLILKNFDRIAPTAKDDVDSFVEVIYELAREGVLVEIEVENSTCLS